MKEETRLYVATNDAMAMRRRRKGESLPPPPPTLLRAGFMAKGATSRKRGRERERVRGGEETRGEKGEVGIREMELDFEREEDTINWIARYDPISIHSTSKLFSKFYFHKILPRKIIQNYKKILFTDRPELLASLHSVLD